MTNNPHKTLKHHKQQIKIFQSLQPPKKSHTKPQKTPSAHRWRHPNTNQYLNISPVLCYTKPNVTDGKELSWLIIDKYWSFFSKKTKKKVKLLQKTMKNFFFPSHISFQEEAFGSSSEFVSGSSPPTQRPSGTFVARV